MLIWLVIKLVAAIYVETVHICFKHKLDSFPFSSSFNPSNTLVHLSLILATTLFDQFYQTTFIILTCVWGLLIWVLCVSEYYWVSISDHCVIYVHNVTLSLENPFRRLLNMNRFQYWAVCCLKQERSELKGHVFWYLTSKKINKLSRYGCVQFTNIADVTMIKLVFNFSVSFADMGPIACRVKTRKIDYY